jgi:hypothetical protein
VPPGVSEYLLLGDGGGSWREEEDVSARSMGDSFDEVEGPGVEPSSASVRALPDDDHVLIKHVAA